MAVLRRIVLRDFRNYENLDLSFADGMNVLVGPNGQGKTNLLEAIYFLSILRSFRCSNVRNLYRWRQSSFMVRGEISDARGVRKAGIEYGEKRRLRINGEPINRASDFIGGLYTVAFVPEDIDLVKGPASVRRRFLDITLTQIEPGYLGVLQAYDKALKSRNALLRSERPDPTALSAFERVLIANGAAIVRHRLSFFQEFANYIDATGKRLLPKESEIMVRYNGLASDPAQNLEDVLKSALDQSRDRDLARRVTHVGPHRDDFQLHLDGRNLSSYGSEGQCRLAAMTLKLAKAEFLFSRRNEEAVVLLVDDVIGELDARRCSAFFDAVSRADQVFVACTELDKVKGLDTAKVFDVSAGVVTEIENHHGEA